LDRLALKSPAKINLFLQVLSEREDGYHQILTLMQAVELCDDIEMEKTETGIRITCDNPDCPQDESNLAYQAASLLFGEKKVDGGIKINITKRIPLSSGLGGGSSNAAATLMGLNRLLQLELPLSELHHLAAQLGSDVPFFLYSGQALAEGRGELIKPLSIYKDYWLLLVSPRLEVSSGWAYRNTKISLTRKRNELNYKLLGSGVVFFEALAHFENDLEHVVVKKHPVVGRIKDMLEDCGAVKSAMSGSGPTVYGVFDQKPQAEEVTKKLSRGDWQVFLTRPIPENARC
jgi:4-diphosphocytidyl-2-C-methyl-D-erythritol kinase